MASSVISIPGVKPQWASAASMIAATVSGGISEGVPPPKKIEPKELTSECAPRPSANAIEPCLFSCVLAVCWPEDGQCEMFEGRVDGLLTWPPRGQNGFGYDPMFQPIGEEQTFGEMESARWSMLYLRADSISPKVWSSPIGWNIGS